MINEKNTVDNINNQRKIEKNSMRNAVVNAAPAEGLAPLWDYDISCRHKFESRMCSTIY